MGKSPGTFSKVWMVSHVMTILTVIATAIPGLLFVYPNTPHITTAEAVLRYLPMALAWSAQIALGLYYQDSARGHFSRTSRAPFPLAWPVIAAGVSSVTAFRLLESADLTNALVMGWGALGAIFLVSSLIQKKFIPGHPLHLMATGAGQFAAVGILGSIVLTGTLAQLDILLDTPATRATEICAINQKKHGRPRALLLHCPRGPLHVHPEKKVWEQAQEGGTLRVSFGKGYFDIPWIQQMSVAGGPPESWQPKPTEAPPPPSNSRALRP